jgi:hypothetical protein
LVVASSTSPLTAIMAVSSAKVATVVPTGCGRSLVYMRSKTGRNTLLCGTRLNGVESGELWLGNSYQRDRILVSGYIPCVGAQVQWSDSQCVGMLQWNTVFYKCFHNFSADSQVKW